MVVDTHRPGSDEETLNRIFRALADPTRRDIVARAVDGELSVSGLARDYPISLAAVQKHVAVLERSGLVSKRRRGREQIVRAELDALRTAHRALDRLEAIWRDRITAMDDLLADPDQEKE